MIQKNKKILSIAAALLACVLMALIVLTVLKKVAPKDDANTTPTPTETTAPETAETKLIKQADSIVKAGEEAFNSRNTDEAIAKFTAAKELYEKAGDTARAEQMADRIAVTQHEATKNPESEPQKAPENPAPSEDAIGGEAAKASSED